MPGLTEKDNLSNNSSEKRIIIKAVIFDMDGLMIDSEPLHRLAFDRVLKRFEYGLTEEENTSRYVGISALDCAKDMTRRYALKVKPNQLASMQHEEYIKLLGTGVIAQIGLIELLTQLRNGGLKTAIASGATAQEIELIVNALKIKNYFDSQTSSQEVKYGKPAPDLFLLAAKKLDEPPNNCLVLEDAPSGIKAAEAAGMLRFAIPSRETRNQNFSNATRILASLQYVFPLLQDYI